jgi:hypothetical protein
MVGGWWLVVGGWWLVVGGGNCKPFVARVQFLTGVVRITKFVSLLLCINIVFDVLWMNLIKFPQINFGLRHEFGFMFWVEFQNH